MRSGIRERLRDRRAHVGMAELRQHRAVDVLDQRMDDALRMDHDLDRSRGTPNSQCASITSRPLFIIVAESTVILRPMRQFGCAQASSGVTFASSASGRVRNGPPEAVSRIAAHAGARRIARVAAAAGTGRSRCARCRSAAASRRPSRTALHERGAADHQRFLVREQDALARARRGERRREAGGADDRGEHGVGARAASRPRQSPPSPASDARRQPVAGERALERARRVGVEQRGDARADARGRARASFSHCRCAASAATAKRSGWRAMTSSVDSPIEPVAPSRLTPCACASSQERDARASAAGGIAASSASMRSSTPPWPGSSVPLSLTPALALQQRLEQVADDRQRRQRERERDPAAIAASGDIAAA